MDCNGNFDYPSEKKKESQMSNLTPTQLQQINLMVKSLTSEEVKKQMGQICTDNNLKCEPHLKTNEK